MCTNVPPPSRLSAYSPAQFGFWKAQESFEATFPASSTSRTRTFPPAMASPISALTYDSSDDIDAWLDSIMQHAEFSPCGANTTTDGGSSQPFTAYPPTTTTAGAARRISDDLFDQLGDLFPVDVHVTDESSADEQQSSHPVRVVQIC